MLRTDARCAAGESTYCDRRPQRRVRASPALHAYLLRYPAVIGDGEAFYGAYPASLLINENMTVYSRESCVHCFLVLRSSRSNVSGADWTRYRGPNGTGISPQTVQFRRSSVPQKTWFGNENSQRKLLAYLTGEEVDDRILMAFDASSGKLIWRKAMRRFGRTSSMR